MKKNILKKYKKLKNELEQIKSEHEVYVETENLERTFSIEVIASTLENRLLAPLDEIKDFWCFITNENVDLSNIYRFKNIIEHEILEQYPNLKILNSSSNKWFLNEDETEFIKKWYINNNGKYISIKSIKKGYSKVLSIQDCKISSRNWNFD